MTSFVLPRPARAFAVPRFSAAALKAMGLALVLAALVAPECCLAGRHAFGPGMDSLGAICRAARA